MRFVLVVLLLMLPACDSSDSGKDAATDARVQDYAVIEGPVTKPVVDLPVHPADLAPPDLAPLDLAPTDASPE